MWASSSSCWSLAQEYTAGRGVCRTAYAGAGTDAGTLRESRPGARCRCAVEGSSNRRLSFLACVSLWRARPLALGVVGCLAVGDVRAT